MTWKELHLAVNDVWSTEAILNWCDANRQLIADQALAEQIREEFGVDLVEVIPNSNSSPEKVYDTVVIEVGADYVIDKDPERQLLKRFSKLADLNLLVPILYLGNV